MGKKKIIGFVIGIAMSCAATSVVSACNFSGGSSETNSSSSSSVQTPVSIEYKVTFDSAGGSSVKAQYVTKGEKAQKPAENPTREGYTFVEWQLNGNAYDFNTAVVGDITLKAKWEKNAPTKFAVSFMVEGESTPFYTAEVSTGKKVMKPADVPTREGYAFDCWTLNGVEFDFETPITQELTLVAKWSNLWTITYDAGEATPFYTSEVVEGAVVTAPTEVPTREGYVFDYWTLNGVEFDFETPVTQAFTLVAKWVNVWMVTFDVGEGNPIDPAMVKDGGMVSMPEGQREGYYVTDWLLNGESFNFATPITENITLTAVWDTDGLYSNQIGIRICGNDVSGQSQWMNKETDDKGATVITAKFQADATYSPALVLREVFPKEYYQGLLDQGYTSITFSLAIDGDITDLYIFGKPITSFVKNNGVYAVVVSLQHIVNHYDTIYTLATSANQAGQATSLSAKFLSWKSPANDYTSTKNYIFTISDIAVSDTFFDFAEGSAATIYTGETTTLEVNTNVLGEVVWSSSDATIATVEDGVVTGLKAGEVTITATLNGLTASKTVKVNYRNQIGARINGNDVTANPNYLQVTTDENGTTVITAKFQADATYSPALIVRGLAEKSVYESLIAEGKTSLAFNLAVEGDVSDLYVFGKALNTFPEIDGEYAVVVSLQRIVEYYETIKTLATSANQAGQASSMSAKFITWKSPAGDWSTVRDYVFTISEVVLDDTAEPTFSVEFAEGSAATIYTGETTTLEVNTNVIGDVVWSSSDATIATVEDGVVTGLKAGEVTIMATLNGLTASKTVKVNYRNQIGVHAYGWDQTGNATYFNMSKSDNGETIIAVQFAGSTTHYPSLTLKEMYNQEYCQALIADGYAKLTFNLKVGGANASDVSDLYIFGKKLTNFAKNAEGVYAIVVDLQFMVDNYDKVSGMGTSVEAKNAEFEYMFLAWKSTDWTKRNYEFTFSNVSLRKGALFSDNIGMRVNGWDMTTNTTYMQMDVAADGAMTITANWQAYANYGPALVLKNMQSKEYYQGLIDSGYTHLTFDLKVGGADADKLDDIHILGSAQKVSACEQVNGVYKVQIQLAHIVQFYDTIVSLDTSGNQAGQWGSRSALLLAWRFSTNFATVPEDATRNYVFTISNTAFSKVN